MTSSEVISFLHDSRSRWVHGQHGIYRALASGLRVQTVNLHHLVLFERDPEFRASMTSADALAADGWPVQDLLKLPESARATGSEFVRELLHNPDCCRFARRIALVGASDEAATKFSKKLAATHRELSTHIGGDARSWDMREIKEIIESERSDLAIVAVTPPRGEVIASKLREIYPGISIIGVGGAIDMAVGIQRPAPKLARNLRAEWLWRLATNPRRMFRRYVLDCAPMYLKLRRVQ